MSGEPLCIRTFAEIVRSRMSKKARIKNFDPEKKSFQSDAEVENQVTINLSQVYTFYKLLLDAVIYMSICNGETGIPDIDSAMTSQLKNGKREIHQKIKEIAQRKETKRTVSDYFEANLVPNIPRVVRRNVLDDINTLVSSSPDIKTRKRKALQQAYRQEKNPAAYLAEIYLIAICSGTNEIKSRTTTAKDSKDPFESLKQLEELLSRFPPPKQISPPKELLEEEQPYISELYAAYGDKEGITDFREAHLDLYDEYKEDRNERRIDYFAADSVRHGVKELYSGRFKNQFEVLKEETLAGVSNTARKSYPNGYERMLSVMEQAVNIQVSQYLLSRSPHWISNKIKMGVCHFLVNDNKLRWVKR
ncbi:ABC-three component system protein [Desulfolucanica intricata]|uniref:ABC-three component system protein n=1 Tax=Desulfolucanica intricata TaxID=1285191 RepID=UPI000833FDC5|nr:ABC-three component system protein [Desulfolucanica intricata]